MSQRVSSGIPRACPWPEKLDIKEAFCSAILFFFFFKQQGELKRCLNPITAKVQFAEILSTLTRGKKKHTCGVFLRKLHFFPPVCHRETIGACKTDAIVINVNSCVTGTLPAWFLLAVKCVYLIFLL